MKYTDVMDKECIRLCDAMNGFTGISTTGSCCGHGQGNFQIYFTVTGDYDKDLPPLLYFFEHCHTGVDGWRVHVFTDCSATPVSFGVGTESIGEKAYEEANKIAECMENFLQKKKGAA